MDLAAVQRQHVQSTVQRRQKNDAGQQCLLALFLCLLVQNILSRSCPIEGGRVVVNTKQDDRREDLILERCVKLLDLLT